MYFKKEDVKEILGAKYEFRGISFYVREEGVYTSDIWFDLDEIRELSKGVLVDGIWRIIRATNP